VSGSPAGALGTQLPRNIGRPGRDALNLAGYERLEQLDGASARELLQLHGVGRVGIEPLHEALAAIGRSLRD
jgi:hypothetical protein